jgi:predicted Holliday junction resolvase-like endonuclease
MQDSAWLTLALILLAAVAFAAVMVLAAAWQRERRRSQARIEQLLAEHERGILDARRESVERSRSSLKGQIAEQLAPLLPGFAYRPADARFLGDPVDYVVFDGYTEARDGGGGAGGGEMEIVILEVKQGGSALSATQKAIARAVEAGRVRFEICRVGEDGTVSAETWRPGRPRRAP